LYQNPDYSTTFSNHAFINSHQLYLHPDYSTFSFFTYFINYRFDHFQNCLSFTDVAPF
jgi:hypothetical protein